MERDRQNQFSRTHIAGRDFKRAGEFIDAARGHSISSVEYEALLLSAVIQYARPFSNNESPKNKNPQADPSVVINALALLGPDHELHHRILLLRNKAVAHAEFDFYPVAPLKSAETGLVISSRSWHIVDEQIDLEHFFRITSAMHNKCLNMAFDLGRGYRVI